SSQELSISSTTPSKPNTNANCRDTKARYRMLPAIAPTGISQRNARPTAPRPLLNQLPSRWDQRSAPGRGPLRSMLVVGLISSSNAGANTMKPAIPIKLDSTTKGVKNPPSDLIREIGRAACRERGWVSEVGG